VSLPAQSVVLLLSEHRREPFTGPVLAYGKQTMNVVYDAAIRIFESLDLKVDPAGLTDPPPGDEVIDFARLVSMMGLGRLHVLDLSGYEGADLIADLNQPVPPEYLNRFGLILDGGTMEHVFDIRQGMKNTADMLRPEGRAVHITPVNNYVNHGFVQVSPTLYHDYYVANGFDDVRGIMIVHPRFDYLNTSWHFFHYEHETMSGVNSMFCTDETQLAVYFTARKNSTSTSGRVPTQSYFTRVYGGTDPLPNQLVIAHDRMKLNVRRINEPESDENKATRDLNCSTKIWSIDFRPAKP
jgi:SAM-dependent methyltransferase